MSEQNSSTRRGRPPRETVYLRLDTQIAELWQRTGGLPSPLEAADIWRGIWFEEAHHLLADTLDEHDGDSLDEHDIGRRGGFGDDPLRTAPPWTCASSGALRAGQRPRGEHEPAGERGDDLPGRASRPEPANSGCGGEAERFQRVSPRASPGLDRWMAGIETV